ncbi:PREDICTED: cycloeucalenol cycloisomerase-like [Amphimedon queenslandica]|uniref:Uncharacterized protein n=1 Tax=Amphimedon queenslandica TaxID=400682 RepID=A0A1X7V922_AMPQE|nr:PREDICTED: cycloeucalenol cycloisomerase-like [Amphimedon queenslandica]|eukprot:XP_003385217.2 PREDICTED: cycloeucalenol cycloisomerase-like [Amphimedon queenslandica]
MMAAFMRSKRKGEKVVLYYTIAWISSMALIVKLKLYESFDSEDYIKIGLALSIPCFLLQLLSKEESLPFYRQYLFKANLFVGIIGYLGNHFYTHYFYNVLGMRYTGPLSGGIRINDVPLSMYLMTHPYFLSYHVLVSPVIRVFRRALSGRHYLLYHSCFGVFVYIIAVTTAFIETYTISSFPYYTYPDFHEMLTYGSLFYGLFFLVSFPLFHFIDESTEWPLKSVAMSAFGSMMIVLLLADISRLVLNLSSSLPYA